MCMFPSITREEVKAYEGMNILQASNWATAHGYTTDLFTSEQIMMLYFDEEPAIELEYNANAIIVKASLWCYG